MTKMYSSKCWKAQIRSEAGFSLIELAIVIIVISLLATPLLKEYTNFRQTEKIDNTDVGINAVKSALNNYYLEFGRYPCPADRSAPYSDTGAGGKAGEEDCAAMALLSAGTCSADNGMCTVAGTDGAVYIGAVPYKTLNMVYSDTLDGYKNHLTYAISANYTDPATAFDKTRKGSVTVTTEARDTSGVITSATKSGYYYVLTSHGEDGMGAFTVQGNLQASCDIGALDGENCDLDAAFLDRTKLYSDVVGGAHYDDDMAAVDRDPKQLWQRSQETTGAIFTDANAIGIGVKDPDTTAKLDVNGVVKANGFQGQYYCDANGANCFETNSIAGTTGMKCANGYMTGIASNSAQCGDVKLNVKPKTCSTDQYVAGVDSGGNIICANLP